MPRIDADGLRGLATGVLSAVGAPAETAKVVSDSLVDTSLAGKDTHGIRLIRRYVNSIQAGKVDPQAKPELCVDEGPIGVVDGNAGLGQLAAIHAADTAVSKAETFGVGVVAVRNTYHIGRVGQYAIRGAERGFVVLAFANASAQVAPYGTSAKMFGTNPFCCAAPRASGPPIVVDAASSLGTVGEVERARSLGRELGDRILMAADGRITRDPAEFGRGALLPIGNHKGSALSFMIEILAGILTGRGSACLVPGFSGNGALFIAIDPRRFSDDFGTRLDALFEAVSSARPANGADRVLVPGEPELQEEQARRKNGIPVDPDTWVFLKAHAVEHRLALPQEHSTRRTVLFVNKLRPEFRKAYSEKLSDVLDLVFPDSFGLEHLASLAKGADVLVGYSFPKEVLENATKCRLVQVTSAGIENIDTTLIRERRILMANSHANAARVAEHGIAMLMTLAKQTALHDRLARRGVESRQLSREPAYASVPIAGSTVGILGLGHIGSQVARMATALGAEVIAYTRSESELFQTTRDLTSVLKAADFLFICLPLTNKTRDLITFRELSSMKPTASLINIARGEIVRESDLFRALEERTIHSAGIDVWNGARSVRSLSAGKRYLSNFGFHKLPVRGLSGRKRYLSSLGFHKLPVPSLSGRKHYLSNFDFHKLDNALLSPHRAAIGVEAPSDVIENLERFASGASLSNLVDLDEGY